MANRPRLFVDMDKCIVITLYCRPDEYYEPDDNWAKEFIHITERLPRPEGGENAGDITLSAARPSTHQFLIELAKLGDVEILTSGKTTLQIPVLRALGLLDLVKAVWCRDNVSEMPLPNRCRWMLIDDNHPVNSIIEQKMAWLGITDHPKERLDRYIRERFAQCSAWTTPPCDPQPLTSLLPLIAAKLERQKHRRKR